MCTCSLYFNLFSSLILLFFYLFFIFSVRMLCFSLLFILPELVFCFRRCSLFLLCVLQWCFLSSVFGFVSWTCFSLFFILFFVLVVVIWSCSLCLCLLLFFVLCPWSCRGGFLLLHSGHRARLPPSLRSINHPLLVLFIVSVHCSWTCSLSLLLFFEQ